MANTAARLDYLLQIKADIAYYTQQQVNNNAKYQANATKLSKYVKLEEKWLNAFDSAIDNEKELKINGVVWVQANNTNESIADAYAHEKVEAYDEAILLDLEDKDIDYDTLKTSIDTLLEKLNADKSSAEQSVSTAAQDTGLSQS